MNGLTDDIDPKELAQMGIPNWTLGDGIPAVMDR
jgi:hypothetical protein